MGRSDATNPADQYAAWAEKFTRGHSENFSVLSLLVPREDRPHFASVYSFCRTADDLADETGSDDAARARSLKMLSEFRGQFDRVCADRSPDDPRWKALFLALGGTMKARQLPPRLFHALLNAFEQDQRVRRYESWDQLVAYSEQSANPVGRLVLMIFGYRPPDENAANADMYLASDEICTALQLINFWQDVRRDLLERDRIYLPLREMQLTEDQMRAWMAGDVDERFGIALGPLVERTQRMFVSGRRMLTMLEPRHGRVIRLFAAGGEAIARKVQEMNYATLWKRPRLRGWEKGWLLMRELMRFGGGRTHASS